ncbi:hypothetical protein [Amycolatopsis speibonae]|uniref:Uncharacterized protein n=1 Tax=Amycolatopsis speibonae TaxID=1450224 RepID=A0ABV7P9D2_9PSEU
MSAVDDEPPEHVRYAAYRRGLAGVADAGEAALMLEVLGDPDRVMAEAASPVTSTTGRPC